mgnify:CR=1 FL=1
MTELFARFGNLLNRVERYANPVPWEKKTWIILIATCASDEVIERVLRPLRGILPACQQQFDLMVHHVQEQAVHRIHLFDGNIDTMAQCLNLSGTYHTFPFLVPRVTRTT